MIGFALIFVTGCTVNSVDTTTRARLHRVALVGPADPHDYFVKSAKPGYVAPVLGVVGFLAASAIADASAGDTPARFDALMQQQDLHLGRDMMDTAEAALRKMGYDVVRVTVSRPDAKSLLQTYDGLAPNVEAVIDATLTAGYADVGPDSAWVPLLFSSVRATFYSPIEAPVLLIGLGCARPSTDPEQAKRYMFDHMVDLLTRPADAATGMQLCASNLGVALANLFKR